MRHTRCPRIALAVYLTVAIANALGAQGLRLSAYGVAASNSEVDQTKEVTGFGYGGGASVDVGRFRVEVTGFRVSLSNDAPLGYKIWEIDGRATYFVRRYLGLQAGFGRRFVDPDFVAQEVGWFRAGILSEAALTRVAHVWATGAVLPATRFNGGGDAGLGLDVGLGAAVGRRTGRLQVFVVYEFQRIGRTVNAIDVPVQFADGRFGLSVKL